jgi:hypothetical protein
MIQIMDPHQKAYVRTHIYEGTRPVLLVSRCDGDWCFLCGEDHDDDASSYRVVGVGYLFQKHPALKELMDLPDDWEAERSAVEEAWLRTECDSDD